MYKLSWCFNGTFFPLCCHVFCHSEHFLLVILCLNFILAIIISQVHTIMSWFHRMLRHSWFAGAMSKTALALFNEVLLKNMGISAGTASVTILHLVCPFWAGIITCGVNSFTIAKSEGSCTLFCHSFFSNSPHDSFYVIIKYYTQFLYRLCQSQLTLKLPPWRFLCQTKICLVT